MLESSERDPLLAARGFLDKLDNIAKFGYEIEIAKSIDPVEPLGHRF